MTLPRFLRDESGLESVEVAICAGLIVAGLVVLIWQLARWVRIKLEGVTNG